MPNYSALNTQIDAVKSEITASLAVGTYTAQDLVYIAKALETLGQMLGINDIVAASADAQASLSSLVTNILNGTANSTTAKLYVGAAPAAYESSAALTNAIATFRWDENNTEASYAQIAFTNDDPTSSTDIIVYANNGDDSTGWFGIGIAGNSFDDATYGITGPQDGYIFGNAKAPITKTITNKLLASNVATLTTSTTHGYAVGKKVEVTGVDATFNGTYVITAVPTTTTFSYAKTATAVASAAASGTSKMYFGKGNVVIATGDTGSENKIILAAGGYASGNEQLSITPDENVHIEIATPSTSATTGALTVVGGVGISGDINVAGDVTIAGTITFGGGGTTVETANIAVTDPAVFVASTNTGNIVDFAFVGKYVTSGNTRYSAFSKDASDGIWKLSSNITSQPTTTINYGQAGLVYDKIYVGQVLVDAAPSASNEVTPKSYVDAKVQNDFVSNLMSVI